MDARAAERLGEPGPVRVLGIDETRFGRARWPATRSTSPAPPGRSLMAATGGGRLYQSLSEIEADFRYWKATDPQLRPIYHWTEVSFASYRGDIAIEKDGD